MFFRKHNGNNVVRQHYLSFLFAKQFSRNFLTNTYSEGRVVLKRTSAQPKNSPHAGACIYCKP